MNVNVRGIMHNIKHATNIMIPNIKGHIISTTSIVDILRDTAPYAYMDSKYEIVVLIKNGTTIIGNLSWFIIGTCQFFYIVNFCQYAWK